MVLSPQTTNVLRYAALGAGVFYGLLHQRTITKQAKVAHEDAEYHRKEELIKKAKAEWARLHPPPKTEGLITDPDDARFDLEAFLNHVAKTTSA
ncbi:hypothetical protein EX30DRAFT_344184 [Ascodesmis nigricans]|uniref:ATP synthase F(0) complex subunit e, mitochondrial n=1 Tax=Ascodesmis nigricans TaxID=341454 RepID=A0A4S2MK79_9PEZI|nr:hypothetical protein EX30DRAFT_344184 [Ascodesmis nigricans]